MSKQNKDFLEPYQKFRMIPTSRFEVCLKIVKKKIEL